MTTIYQQMPRVVGESQLIESAPKILALLSTGAIALSASYELGYFGVFGYSLMPLLSATDLLFDMVFWFPLLVLVVGASILAVPTFDRIFFKRAKGTSDAAPRVDSNQPQGLRNLFKYVVVMNVILLVVFVIRTFIGSLHWTFSAFAAVLLSQSLLGFHALGQKKISIVPLMTVLALVFLALSFLEGAGDARTGTRAFSPVIGISRKSEPETRYFVLVRNLQRGLFIRDTLNSRFVLIPWEDITRISSSVPPSGRNYVCEFIGIACGEVPNP